MSTNTNRTTKTKRSYSLSPKSVEFLDDLRKKHRARSVSAVLEELVQEARRQEQMKIIDEQTTAFYDSLTDEEREEERGWAELGMRALQESDF
jgi:Arc/MetJ-type ribon-helix-helix transcriptional regulator